MTHTAALASSILAKIPSPDRSQYHLGPIPVRMYALCILAGIIVAVWLGDKRWQARGGRPQEVVDIAIWAVPFGLVGGRLYHVITTSDPYFGKDGDWVKAFYVWQGGLGIWGAIALGGVGAWIGCRKHHASLRTFADAVAPGIVLAQALGRWGNWFNNELYGKPTTLPWGLQVHCMDQTTQQATPCGAGTSTIMPGLYHPTFLYESIWCVGVAILVIWADKKFTLGYGRAFALYVAAYTVGRGWIEYLRIDQAHHILGLRLNDWTALIVFVGAVVYFILSAKRHPGRETTPYYGEGLAAAGEVAGSETDGEVAAGGVEDAADTAPVAAGAGSIGGKAPEPEKVDSDGPEADAASGDAAEATAEAESVAGSETGSGAEPESEARAASESETEHETESESETKLDTESESEHETGSGAGTPVKTGTTTRNETTE